jgi:hypothetical protein
VKRCYWGTLALLFTLDGPSIMAQSTTACKLNPTNRTVTICTPQGRSSTSPVESPVRVVAGCADSTPISIIQIYIDGQKVTQFSSNQIDMTIPMASGNNNISVLCKDSSGAFFSTHVKWLCLWAGPRRPCGVSAGIQLDSVVAGTLRRAGSGSGKRDSWYASD